ncbi:MAG: DNA mismatch repair endonuclease MutL [Thermoplasmata archaeon]|nr:DNA mismatch repair endonuclease MutL [Thermoplasmata archaeon]
MSGPRRPIHRLDPETIERIAAGEVVERPASVVKELFENALDAGATSVSVRLADGGLSLIEVADNGGGIPAAELPLALERHATNKLSGPEGLSAIATLGFRGEALAAIASVSRLRLLSRYGDESEAHGLDASAGQLGPPFTASRAPGTTVGCESLFFNTPARRKFLRSAPRERLEVLDTLQRAYLASSAVAVDLSADGVELLRLPASRDLAEACAHVLGPEFDAVKFEVRAEDGARGTLEGWFAGPAVSRSSGRGVYLCVNGRPVSSRPLAQAIRAAFGDRLPRTRQPVGVLHLHLDPTRVDVNVHPSKREVRFEREPELAEWIRRAVRSGLVGGPEPAHDTVEPERFAPVPRTLGSFTPSSTTARHRSSAPAARQARLDSPRAKRSVAAEGTRPALTLLGSVDRLYWVAESGADLLLLDQHAASERVWYEALLAHSRLGQQRLVQPVSVRLAPREAEVARERLEYLRSVGFEVEPMGGAEWWLRGLPSFRGRTAPAEEFPRLLAELADGGRPSVPDGLVERTAASVACHAAVRAGDRIDAEEMGRILAGLYALPSAPTSCPHGRPIAVRLPRGRLDRWFGRSSV